MPQMGESIAEGTITRWIKQVGDTVEQDEPFFEISTDKVDAEIPSPAAGEVVEIHGKEGDTVEVNTVVAVIETGASAGVSPKKTKAPKAAPEKKKPRAAPPAAPPAPAVARPAAAAGAGPAAARVGGRFFSPVVRKIAAEARIDPSVVRGTGAGGRVTKKDILAYVERPTGGVALAGTAVVAPPPAAATSVQPDAPPFPPGESTVSVPMSVMRQRIAEHMIESRRTSAHVHSVFEVDLTHAVQLRDRHKQSYVERHGASLTYMSFFIRAVCDALRAWPIVNSSVVDALDAGLIVPVIRGADRLSIVELCRSVADLAHRARSKKLNPEEVHGGTFTITNPGTFGGLYGLPIINQPQVAILGIGWIQKRPVVINDAIAVRSMMYMAMSYDHRVVDGAVADQFLARVQYTLEQFDESLL
jgi:2-oxoglutarate dehydrogenase E2 component (dihydrolipoamide succinyltransferase)